jgi:hypothetical protein
MKRQSLVVLAAGVFCLLAAGRCLWLAVGPSSWGPRFACTEPYFDCGKVAAHRTIEHDFIVKNSGREPLHILKAVPGCGGCLTVNVSEKEIVPGGCAVVKVVLDVTKVRKGEFKKALLLKTDDPYLPRVILYLQGTAV